jgi:hypothetical protein
MKEVPIKNEYLLNSLNRNNIPEIPAMITKIDDVIEDKRSFALPILKLMRIIINETIRMRNPSII